jgi:lipid A disaccharide synthetase
LNWIRGDTITTLGATRMDVCSALPTSYAEALSLSLASCALTTASFDAPTTAAGSARLLNVLAQADKTITASGTATHVVLTGTGSVLMYATECTTQALTSNNTVTIPAWTITVDDNNA